MSRTVWHLFDKSGRIQVTRQSHQALHVYSATRSQYLHSSHVLCAPCQITATFRGECITALLHSSPPQELRSRRVENCLASLRQIGTHTGDTPIAPSFACILCHALPVSPQLTCSHTCICLWQARTNGEANCDASPGVPAKNSPVATYAEGGRRRASSGGMAKWRGGAQGREVARCTFHAKIIYIYIYIYIVCEKTHVPRLIQPPSHYSPTMRRCHKVV